MKFAERMALYLRRIKLLKTIHSIPENTESDHREEEMMFESLRKLRELDIRVDGSDKALVHMEKLLGLPPVPPLGEIVVDGSKQRSLRANLLARLDQHDERLAAIAAIIAARGECGCEICGEPDATHYNEDSDLWCFACFAEQQPEDAYP